MHIYSVLAHMDAKMVRPEPQRPFEGLITIHCELSPMASTEYEPGRYVHWRLCPRAYPLPNPISRSFHLHRQSDEEVSLARMLDKIFRRSDTIDREALCILAGERVRPSLLFPPYLPSYLLVNPPYLPSFLPRSGTSAYQSTPSQTQAVSSTAQV